MFQQQPQQKASREEGAQYSIRPINVLSASIHILHKFGRSAGCFICNFKPFISEFAAHHQTLAMNPSVIVISKEAAHDDSEPAAFNEDRKDRLMSSLERSLVENLDLSKDSYKWLQEDRGFRFSLIRSSGRCQSLRTI